MNNTKQSELTDIAYNFSNNFNDIELDFIITELLFWQEERKRQETEDIKNA